MSWGSPGEGGGGSFGGRGHTGEAGPGFGGDSSGGDGGRDDRTATNMGTVADALATGRTLGVSPIDNYQGSYAQSLDSYLSGLSIGDHSMIGGLRSGDRDRAGLSPGGEGGNDAASVINHLAQGLGLGFTMDDFWAEYEARYGKPQMPQAQVEEAMTGAEAQRAKYGELTNKLLQNFQTNWRKTFGGEGEMFPHIEGGTK